MSDYYDIREKLFRNSFAEALPYDQYVESGSSLERTKWRQNESSVLLTQNHKKIIAEFKRKMPVIVLSGIWCGDCARQGPIINAIAKESKTIDLRFVENQKNQQLKDELRICGAERVPVVVAMSEDFFEVARFGDKHLSIYLRKLSQEMGASCELGFVPNSSHELEQETGEWLSFFERAQALMRLAPGLRRRYND